MRRWLKEKFLFLNDNLAEKELINFTENALQYGGVFSVLFHCSFFWLNPDKRFKIFESLLQFLAEKEVKVGTCRDVFYGIEKCVVLQGQVLRFRF